MKLLSNFFHMLVSWWSVFWGRGPPNTTPTNAPVVVVSDTTAPVLVPLPNDAPVTIVPPQSSPFQPQPTEVPITQAPVKPPKPDAIVLINCGGASITFVAYLHFFSQ
jgi:hypothetical protein